MNIELYTKPTCPFCNRAKALLDEKGLAYTDHDISNDPELRAKVSESVGGYNTVPMIFIENEFIGGCSELQALDEAGKLG